MKIQKDTQIMLDTLKEAVAEALEKKKKLEQYAVMWKDNKVHIVTNNDPKAKVQEGL